MPLGIRNCLSLVLVFAWCQWGIYLWYSLYCRYPSNYSGVRAMIVSDVHLLGYRRRSKLERQWVDWQIHMSFRINVWLHPPDVILVLGDQFDEGGPPTSAAAWKEYAERFFDIFTSSNIPYIFHIGNHDTAFGHLLSRSMLNRHEKTFGASNKVHRIGNETFIQLNSMVFVDSVRDMTIWTEANQFVEDLAKDRLKNGYPPAYLLLHMPLYRENDEHCGPERAGEGGHVTYDHPSTKYRIDLDVTSQNRSQWILDRLKPSHVFSGHTHAICRHVHENGIPEFTVPAFSWGMRPDPSFGFANLDRGHVEIQHCRLPHETYIFWTYGVWVVCNLIFLCKRYIKKEHAD